MLDVFWDYDMPRCLDTVYSKTPLFRIGGYNKEENMNRGETIKVYIDCRGYKCGDCHFRDGQICRAFGSILSNSYDGEVNRCPSCQDAEQDRYSDE